jgi:hypothetical protein
LYYTGVPDTLRNIHIYNDNFYAAIQIAYRNPALSAVKGAHFPLLTDDLEHVHFLEYARRRMVDRGDLVLLLEARRRCEGTQRVALTWDFASSADRWEAWNQLATPASRDGTLRLQSLGQDPNLGGPAMKIAAVALGEIEIEMRVRAGADRPQGSVLWMLQGQDEFSPAQKLVFPILADDQFHTYRVDIVRDGEMMIDDSVTRLRLDPLNMPGEIDLKAIRVNERCFHLEGDTCKCQ